MPNKDDQSVAVSPQRARAKRLSAVNAILIFGLIVRYYGDLHFLVRTFNVSVALSVVSMIFQYLAYRVRRNRPPSLPIDIACYCWPGLVVLGLYVAVLFIPDPPNRLPSSVSASGEYVLEVACENPNWVLRATDRNGTVVFEDSESYVADLPLYWLWDPKEDRIWFFDGLRMKIAFVELSDPDREIQRWGMLNDREINREIDPPPELIPETLPRIIRLKRD